eukprot:CAMPEP_0173059286 /NCGR_PEP_ID=MMETSP1102-20130122/1879_1 /TAXON_ID=49646 /ORGANISM="Geminigera sp., Strain Caron Lab Isolate" /LENGTH=93 /DNA_ID=CAMNT_0013925231 /DNA_START=1181 /DNA_END=1462 /DNA_ORIENTATION=-
MGEEDCAGHFEGSTSVVYHPLNIGGLGRRAAAARQPGLVRPIAEDVFMLKLAVRVNSRLALDHHYLAHIGKKTLRSSARLALWRVWCLQGASA